MPDIYRSYVPFFLIIICVSLPSIVYSGILRCKVEDNKGNLVADAVVSAMQISANINKTNKPKKAVIDQVDKEFVEHVTVIQVGTAISFPNNDKIRHHVYSFSPAKKFEIPLYPPGTAPGKPIVFDKPGVAVLGCNIHDWMKAYVCVLETPFFAKTNTKGMASITDLPPGEYEVHVWHPIIKESSNATKQQVTIDKVDNKEIEFTIVKRRVFRPMRAPKLSGGIYR